MADKKRSSGDAGQEEVQAKYDEEQERGYRGSVPDPTPNDAYTVAGVTSGAPTPETDAALHEEAEKRSAGLGAASASHEEAK